MKKTIFKTAIVLFSMSLLFIGCSKDDNDVTDSSAMLRTAGEIYPQFAELLHEKYSDSYDVRTLDVIEDDNKTYIVSEVYVYDEEKKEDILKGYFLEDKDKQHVVYLEEVKETGRLLYFEHETGVGYKMTEYDLTKDAAYNDLGFSINMPDEEIYGKRKFWGWGGWTQSGECNSAGQMPIVNTHYVLWSADVREYDVVPCSTNLSTHPKP